MELKPFQEYLDIYQDVSFSTSSGDKLKVKDILAPLMLIDEEYQIFMSNFLKKEIFLVSKKSLTTNF